MQTDVRTVAEVDPTGQQLDRRLFRSEQDDWVKRRVVFTILDVRHAQKPCARPPLNLMLRAAGEPVKHRKLRVADVPSRTSALLGMKRLSLPVRLQWVSVNGSKMLRFCRP